MFVFPTIPYSYVENITTNVMVLGGEVRPLRDNSVINGIRFLIRRDTKAFYFPLCCEDTARRQPCVNHVRKGPSPEPDHTGTLILDFQAPEL